MVRRWLIRLPFLLALAIVVGVWIASYFGAMSMSTCFGKGGRAIDLYGVQGLCVVQHGLLSHYTDRHLELVFIPRVSASFVFFGRTPFGFGFYSDPTRFPKLFEIAFPLWLPSFLLAVFNWYVWRRTRPMKPWRAFPLESTVHEVEKI